MKTININLSTPIQFHMTGKFEAPSEKWVHMRRELFDYELIIMTDGELYMGEGNEEYTVNSNEYRIVSPGWQFGSKPSKCSFYWLHFSQPRSISAASDGASLDIPIQGEIPRLDRLMIMLKQLQDCDQKYHNQTFNNYLASTILCELDGQINISSDRLLADNINHQLYLDIQSYIDWRIKEDIKVTEIAENFGYNPKYITTFFKKASGYSLKQYILNRKIETAKAMLYDTTDPISQIAYAVGFSDNHNFSNAFKKITGQTPTEYRATYEERLLFHK